MNILKSFVNILYISIFNVINMEYRSDRRIISLALRINTVFLVLSLVASFVKVGFTVITWQACLIAEVYLFILYKIVYK